LKDSEKLGEEEEAMRNKRENKRRQLHCLSKRGAL